MVVQVQSFHRRLAEITDKYVKNGQGLSKQDSDEIVHLLLQNLEWITQLDRLEVLSEAADLVGDLEWRFEIYSRTLELMEGRDS